MKKQFLYTLLLSFAIIFTTACGGDDGPTAQQLTFQKLSGNWDLNQGGSIMIDGQDASANFVGFTVSIADGTYSTTNAGDLFRATGTWQWVDEEAQQLSIDDGKTISIADLTENTFVFNFTTNGSGGAANGIAGNYTITVNN